MSEQMQEQEKPLSREEMEARQTELQNYYQSQIPFLKTQLEYQTLVVELEELDVRRARAMVMMGQIMAPAPKPEDGEPQPRKLKKED